MNARITLLDPKDDQWLPILLEDGDEVEVVGFVNGLGGQLDAVIVVDGRYTALMVRLLRHVDEKVPA